MNNLRVFVSGPYGDSNPSEIIAANVARATSLARNLLVGGHWVFVPHSMSWGWQHDGRLREDQYKALDMTFLGHWAQAIIRIPGRSNGADAEMERARELGLIVLPYDDWAGEDSTIPSPCRYCWRPG